MSDYILETQDLTKHYGGVHALTGANFQLKHGEHVAIMGDNGAGKSTFVRQITGVEQRTRGDIIFDGKPVYFSGPLEAREAGIEAVFQTLALADDLDVPDNLFLGREKTKWDWLGPFRLLDYNCLLYKVCAKRRWRAWKKLLLKFLTYTTQFVICQEDNVSVLQSHERLHFIQS